MIEGRYQRMHRIHRRNRQHTSRLPTGSFATASFYGMLTVKHGKLKAVEPEGAEMNLENEVRTVMRQSGNALTVDQVTQEVAERIKDEIRSILNTMAKDGELTSI